MLDNKYRILQKTDRSSGIHRDTITISGITLYIYELGNSAWIKKDPINRIINLK